MTRRTIPSAVTMATLILSATGCTQSHQDPAAVARIYEQAVDDLAVDRDAAVVQKAMKTLSRGELEAFPALVAHVNDPRPVSLIAYGYRDEMRNTAPTIGEACLTILQNRVEGKWLKAYVSYHYLRSDNVASWWEANQGKPLGQLRIEAAEAALDIARQDAAPGNVIRFLEKRLKDVQAGRWVKGTWRD